MTLKRAFAPSLLACLLAGTAAFAADAPLLHPVFQDHGVLQRDRPLPVYGFAKPGDTVTVTLGGVSAKAKADKEGRWQATLPAQKAGGPFVLTAKAGVAEAAASDVMVGDVYLCSGQSNMELPVSRGLDAWSQTNQANHPLIRYMAVQRDFANTPRTVPAKPVSWRPVSPQTVSDMSAACYYFARDLRQVVDVPVGLIGSAWGGSAAEAWTGGKELRAIGSFGEGLDMLSTYDRDRAAGTALYARQWQSWWKASGGTDQPWADGAKDGDGYRPVPATLGTWEHWGVPELEPYNGVMWLRTEVTLTADQAQKVSRITLGRIDELDVTWINGQPVGSLYDPASGRDYPIAPGTLKAGVNRINLAILDLWGEGGPRGPVDDYALVLADGTRIPLSGPWHYRAAPDGVGSPPRAPWESVSGLGTLYNAMVAPLGPMALRGALWYQGESNTDRAAAYPRLMAGLMASWRTQFGADLPFLIVQLPEFGYPTTTPVDSGWSDMRAAQRQAVLNDKHAGLVVGIGVGDWYDVHPANKQIIGRRLARAAQSVFFGMKVPPSGPTPAAVTRQGDTISVRFTDIDGSLQALASNRPVGFQLCDQGPGTCRYVDASLSGDTVTIPVGNGPAVRVRYCWGDGPICNLYDSARMPAGPFEAVVK